MAKKEDEQKASSQGSGKNQVAATASLKICPDFVSRIWRFGSVIEMTGYLMVFINLF